VFPDTSFNVGLSVCDQTIDSLKYFKESIRPTISLSSYRTCDDSFKVLGFVGVLQNKYFRKLDVKRNFRTPIVTLFYVSSMNHELLLKIDRYLHCCFLLAYVQIQHMLH